MALQEYCVADWARKLQRDATAAKAEAELDSQLIAVCKIIRNAAMEGKSGTRWACGTQSPKMVESLIKMGYNVIQANDTDCDYEKILGYDISW